MNSVGHFSSFSDFLPLYSKTLIFKSFVLVFSLPPNSVFLILFLNSEHAFSINSPIYVGKNLKSVHDIQTKVRLFFSREMSLFQEPGCLTAIATMYLSQFANSYVRIIFQKIRFYRRNTLSRY